MKPSDGGPDRTGPTRRALLVAGSAAGLATGVRAAAPAILRGLPDVLVVGAGVFGGWTALSLREAGARVTLVDAYGAGNPRGSSGDESRLLRLSYGEREFYTRWAMQAEALWKGREAEFGRRLFYPNGSLRVMPDKELAATRQIFDRLHLAYELLGPEEVRHRWPQLNYDDVPSVFYEPHGGVVKARETMIAVAEVFARKGGEMRIGHVTIADGGNSGARARPEARIDGAPFSAGQIVFACGPWLPKVMPRLLSDRIRVPRREIFYVGSPIDNHAYRWEHLPNLADQDTYTASDIDYGVKVAAKLPDIDMDPDRGVRMPSPFLAGQVRDYVARRMPGLADQPIVATRICQTEYSSNGDFIIDRHPDFETVWIAGGGSGHAFKMGPRLGAYIAERVLGRPGDPEAARRFALASHGSAIGARASI